jgi:2-iminobutanoate/2-iminopropanoate deaminase
MITGRLAAPSADAPFSDGVIVEGSLAFLAGQGPIRNGTIVRGSLREQTDVTLRNRVGCLARLGADKSAMVTCTCYLSNLDDISAFNAAYRAGLSGPEVQAGHLVQCGPLVVRGQVPAARGEL